METPIVFAEDLPDSTIHDRLRRGDLVRLARGVYTTDVASDPTDVVRRWWQKIVGRRFRGAVAAVIAPSLTPGVGPLTLWLLDQSGHVVDRELLA